MTTVIFFVMVLLIATKLLDVLSTSRRIQSSMNETNPIARSIMMRVGEKTTIWLVFLFAVIIIAFAGFLAMVGGRFAKGIFVVVGMCISIVQTAVAHANWYRRDNAITKLIRKTYLRIGRLFSHHHSSM